MSRGSESSAAVSDDGSTSLAEAIAEHADCPGTLDVAPAEERPGVLRLSCPGCGARVEHRMPSLLGGTGPAPAGDATRSWTRGLSPPPAFGRGRTRGAASSTAGEPAPEAGVEPDAFEDEGAEMEAARDAVGEEADPGSSPDAAAALPAWMRPEHADARSAAFGDGESASEGAVEPEGGERGQRASAARSPWRGVLPLLVIFAALAAVVAGLIVLRDRGAGDEASSGGAAAGAGGTVTEPARPPRATGGRAKDSSGAEAGKGSADSEGRRRTGGGSRSRDSGSGGGTGTRGSGTQLGFVEVGGAVRIGLPRDWSQRGVGSDGSLVFAPPEGDVVVRVWFDRSSRLGARAVATKALELLTARHPDGRARGPVVGPGGRARASVDYPGGTDVVRAAVDRGTRILAVATIPAGAPGVRRAEAGDVAGSVRAG